MSASDQGLDRTVFPGPRARRGTQDADRGAVLGDERARLDAAYACCGTTAYALAFHLLGDQQRAADVVRDAFALWWDDASAGTTSCLGDGSEVLTRVHRLAVQAARVHGPRPSSGVNLGQASPLGGDATASSIRRLRVRQALMRQPTGDRQILLLALLGGCTLQEIAGITGRPVAAVRTRTLAAMTAVGSDAHPAG